MIHPLNNAVWTALSTGNKKLSQGKDEIKYFKTDVAPFAGMAEYTPENFKFLYDEFDGDRIVVLFSTDENLQFAPWNLLVKVPGYQMIFEGEAPVAESHHTINKLSVQDVPEMLTLTQLTQPGPFSERTIEFGDYVGIHVEGKLVAMAGRRLHSDIYVEVSAVCTHPDHVGKGYARLLINALIRQIQSAGCVPYLHVREDNIHAVELYKRMGFAIRTPIYFYVLQRSAVI